MNEFLSGFQLAEPKSNEGEDDPDPRLSIDCVLHDGDWSACEPIDQLIANLVSVLQTADIGVPHARSAAAVGLSNDDHVRQLNQQFRNIDKPTNVLSFPAPLIAGNANEQHFLGDIVLAAETVTREAAERGISPRAHCAHLVVHGLLHLLGYDHETDDQALHMESTETLVLVHLGIADPYTEFSNDNPQEAVDHRG